MAQYDRDAHDDDDEVYLTSNIKKEEKKKKKKMIKKGIRIAMLCISCILCVLLIIITMAFLKRGRSSYRMKENSVILISIDGFRANYLEEYKDYMPNINKYFKKNGVRAKSMKPIYPSKTFPNHWTLVTGLYAESHGIIANHMYDPTFNATFDLGAPESFKARWWNGESIWETASKYNINSGICFWPGSEVEGRHPYKYLKFNQSMKNKARVDTIIEYLNMDYTERPQFFAVYFDTVDTAGHEHGPDSKNVLEAIKDVDAAIGELISWLQASLVDEFIDIIIVSDHGMTPISKEKTYYILDYIPEEYQSRLLIENEGPLMDISIKGYDQKNPNDRNIIEAIKDSLKSANLPQMTIMEKFSSIPEEYHYQNNIRIAPLLLRMDLGWSMMKSTNSYVGKGNHGYDNKEEDMQAVFMARGPSFKSNGSIIESFANVNIYPLLAKLLNITPAPNNGTIAPLREALKN